MKKIGFSSIAGSNVRIRRCIRRAVQLIMLSGQQVEEIAAFHETQGDAPERIIDWSKTKNTRPHAIPLPDLAAELVESITPNGTVRLNVSRLNIGNLTHYGRNQTTSDSDV